MGLLTRFALVAVAAVGTAATLRREGAGPAMAGGCGYCSSGPCVPTGSLSSLYQTDVPGKNAKLRLTVTIPGTSDSFRNPFPVIFFFNGFQVRTINEPSTPENTASLTPRVHGHVLHRLCCSMLLMPIPESHFQDTVVQARAGFYQAYAERMASWGFLVVQYSLPLFWIIPDANEVRSARLSHSSCWGISTRC